MPEYIGVSPKPKRTKVVSLPNEYEIKVISRIIKNILQYKISSKNVKQSS